MKEGKEKNNQKSSKYKKKYFELYRKVATLLVSNKHKNYTPTELLYEWDKLRTKID